MKKLVLMACLAAAAGTSAGTATYSFSWYRNAAVADFPVPITLEEGRNGFTYAGFADAAGGTDLRASDGNGVNLPLEIETWDPGGRSVVWVQVPSLTSTTTLTLSWGDASAAVADASGLWGTDTMAILHFGDAPGLNSAHGDTLSPAAGASVIARDRAPVGNGAVFTRAGVYCTENAASADYWPETTNQFTISFWLKTDKLTRVNDPTYLCQWGYFTNPGKTAANQMAILINWNVNAGIDFFTSNGPHYLGSFNATRIPFPTDGGWHHVAYTSDGETSTAYLDGSIAGTCVVTNFSPVAWGQYGGYLSVGGTHGGLHLFDGAMDEFRFERVCRSADWIRAEVETQAIAFEKATVRFCDYVGASLTDFPAYIHVDRNMGIDPGLLYQCLTNGTAQVADLRTGAPLPVEIEYAFNNAFDKSLGMWVKMPTYSSADGVVITTSLPHYLPAGTVPSGSVIDSASVWDSDDFLLVFHMNPTGYLHDVKSNVRLKPSWGNNKGECANAYPVATDGPTGPYQAYWSTTNAVQIATSTIARAITNVYTVSWWAKEDEDEFVNPKSETYGWTLLGVSTLKGAGYSKNHGTGPNKMVIWGGVKDAALEIPDAGWHHYVYSFNGVKTYCYRDGELVTSQNGGKNFSCSPTISKKTTQLMGSGNAQKDAFRGCADEVRLETVCRSADWIKATYLNQLAWRNGTPWQLAPHFADAMTASVVDGALTAQATLSCRTNAVVTAYWSRTDGGTDASAWMNAVPLGSKADGLVALSAVLPQAGVRYAVRFQAVNEFGEAWSSVRYAMAPVARAHGSKVKVSVNYAGGETLTDFPLCVRIPAANGLPDDPGMVRILDADGNVLAWEAEAWNPSGESVLWVRVPSLAGTTSLTIAFDETYPADDGAWAADTVWPVNEYAGVWHFAASTKSGVVTEDATAFGAKITSNGRNAYATNGIAGTAYHFPTNTTGTFVSSFDTPFYDFREGFTFSFWAKIPERLSKGERAWSSGNDWQDFVKHELKGYPTNVGYVQIVVRYDAAAEGTVDLDPYCKAEKIVPPGLNHNYVSDNMRTTTYTARALSGVCRAAKPDEDWHHYAFTHDGMYLATYLDGTFVRHQFWPFVLNTAVQNVKQMQTAFGSNTHNAKIAKGTLDEYRAERVGRSAAWIKACYDNLKPGSTFVTVGATMFPGTIIIFR